MAYDDGYYYGQCKIICSKDGAEYEGKTVSIKDPSNKTWSATLTNGSATITVPGRNQYTVELLDGATVKWSGKVEVGYGDCVNVILEDGHLPVIEGNVLTIDEMRETEDVDGKIPDAASVKMLDANLTANDIPFRFGYDSEKQRYGYIVKKDGADSVIPFNAKIVYAGAVGLSDKFRFTMDCKSALFIIGGMYYGDFTVAKDGEGKTSLGVTNLSMIDRPVYKADVKHTVTNAGKLNSYVGYVLLEDVKYGHEFGLNPFTYEGTKEPAEDSLDFFMIVAVTE